MDLVPSNVGALDRPRRRRALMNRNTWYFLVAPAVTWLAIAAAAWADDGLPQPLSVEQALAYAPGHPRTQLALADREFLPRRQPLYLDCHRRAFGSTSGIENARNGPVYALVAPVAAQELEILERFFDVLLADLSFSRYDEAMSVAYVQYDRANARRELGQYSDLRVAELAAAYQDVRQRRAASEAAQRLTRSLLAQALNHPSDLPRELRPPKLPVLPKGLPELDSVVKQASDENGWIARLAGGSSEAKAELIQMELRQQALELLLRLQALEPVAQYARVDSNLRDLKLDQSRTLYEREYTADLGFSMSRQTAARLRERQIAYCQVLTWAELNALQGKPVWPAAEGEK